MKQKKKAKEAAKTGLKKRGAEFTVKKTVLENGVEKYANERGVYYRHPNNPKHLPQIGYKKCIRCGKSNRSDSAVRGECDYCKFNVNEAIRIGILEEISS